MPPPVDFYCSLAHYVAHLAPVWHALGPEHRGTWWGPSRVLAEARAHGVAVTPGRPPLPRRRRPREREPRLVVVAGQADVQLCAGHPLALVEHGAGQVYSEPDPSYSGGTRREAVVLFLCPSEVVAARNRARYPDATVAVVGSPRVDHLVSRFVKCEAAAVVLSFHWPANLGHSPEASWALPHYEAALPQVVAELQAQGREVLGHGHPRYAGFFHTLWAKLGVEHVARFDEVCERAGLYVCDNSSTLYEFAALGRPVVVLNSPRYRRDVDLWPRFWQCADVGLQVSEPAELGPALGLALYDPPPVAGRRAEVVAEVYGQLDGRAAERAAHALVAAAADLQ